MSVDRWRAVAKRQSGLLTRAQLAAVGVDRWFVRHRVRSERWQEITSTVICTTTGELSRHQLMWSGILHGGPGSVLGELTSAEIYGLAHWYREEITVMIPRGTQTGRGIPGVRFRESRRPYAQQRVIRVGLPVSRIEPAALHFASRQSSPRTAEGVLAAVIQQQLSTPDALLGWIDTMRPLRGAARFRTSLAEISGGAQSVAEIDVRRMCRRFGFATPVRQVKRRDHSGRLRFTDCEWLLPTGRVLVLEVDGGFHMDVEHWEDDIARGRALASSDRLTVRCTARELRDEPDRVARDLVAIGLPTA